MASLLLSSAIDLEGRLRKNAPGSPEAREQMQMLAQVCREYTTEHEFYLRYAYPISEYKNSLVWTMGEKPTPAVDLRQVMTMGEIALLLIRGDPAPTIEAARDIITRTPGHEILKKNTQIVNSIRWYNSAAHICAAYRLFLKHEELPRPQAKDRKIFRASVAEILMLARLVEEKLKAVMIKRKPYNEFYKLAPLGKLEFRSSQLSNCQIKYPELADR